MAEMTNDKKALSVAHLGLVMEAVNAGKDVATAWADLKALRDSSKLIPGQVYRITDYVTTTVQAETQSAGHAFDIIVVATGASTLNEDALAARHDGDTYFENAKVDAWRLKYCIDNDTARFAWADTANGRGVVYELEDEWGNRLPFDFKNIQFRRYTIKSTTLGAMDGIYDDLVDGGIGAAALPRILPTGQTNQRISAPGKWMHRYGGYKTEQELFDDGYVDSWDGTYEMEDGGTRLFCVLYWWMDDPGVIVEVENPCWCHAFSRRTAITATETEDYSLTGYVQQAHIAAQYTTQGVQTLTDILMLGSTSSGTVRYCRHLEVTGSASGVTFGSYLLDVSVSGHLDGVLYQSYLKQVEVSGKIYQANFTGHVESCSFTGGVEYSQFTGDIGYSQFTGGVEYSQFTGNLYSCSFTGYVGLCSFTGYVWQCSFTGYVGSCSFTGHVEYSQFTGDVRYSQFTGDVGYSQFTGHVESCSFTGDVWQCSFTGHVEYSQFTGYVGSCSFTGYVESCSFTGNVKYSVLEGNLQSVTFTTPSGNSGTIQNMHTFGTIENKTVSVASESKEPIFVAMSGTTVKTWNPAA